MEKIKLFPATSIQVIDPETHKPIPPEGKEVELTPYFEERMKEGTLVPENPLDGLEEAPEFEEIAFDKMKVADLKDLAVQQGIEGAEGMKKPELVEALEALKQD